MMLWHLFSVTWILLCLSISPVSCQIYQKMLCCEASPFVSLALSRNASGVDSRLSLAHLHRFPHFFSTSSKLKVIRIVWELSSLCMHFSLMLCQEVSQCSELGFCYLLHVLLWNGVLVFVTGSHQWMNLLWIFNLFIGFQLLDLLHKIQIWKHGLIERSKKVCRNVVH